MRELGVSVERLHAAYALSRDPQLRAELVDHYDNLARSLARRFTARRESREDLLQVARVGLINAVDRFDPNRNRPFIAFARATILGELMHHVRDHTWALRVPRPLKEHYLHVVRSIDDLTQELGRAPRVPEVAARAGLSEEQVTAAIHVSSVDCMQSLDLHDDGYQLHLAKDDPALQWVEDRTSFIALFRNLPEQTQRVLELHFVHALTQAEIAERIGRSQMFVSRALTRTLAQIRLTADPERSIA